MQTNREKYLFDDFTFDNYRRLIRMAKSEGFEFILHKDAKERFDSERRDIIWRHDVEFSPVVALRMAEIEHDEGVQSTYFWQLHTDYYNTASPFFTDLLIKIESLGHCIGLHFDSHFWDIRSEDALDRSIQTDASYLEHVVRGRGQDVKLDTFSFHNTNQFVLGCQKLVYGGLINVYSSYYRERYDYCADSTGIWRYDRLEEKLLDPSVRHLHVLTHDGMWSDVAMSPHARIMDCIQDEADRKKRGYAKGLPRTGNINVGEVSINPGIGER